MNTLWPMGQGTVREIRDRLAERRPRAYTTIMTIMDRSGAKGCGRKAQVRARLHLRSYIERSGGAHPRAEPGGGEFFRRLEGGVAG